MRIRVLWLKLYARHERIGSCIKWGNYLVLLYNLDDVLPPFKENRIRECFPPHEQNPLLVLFHTQPPLCQCHNQFHRGAVGDDMMEIH